MKFIIRNFLFFLIAFSSNIYSQNKSLDDIYKEINDTNEDELKLMIEFLAANEPDFLINTDINYLFEIVHKKSQAFFGLDKLYTKNNYGVEAYLFYSTSSHSNTFIMLYAERDVLFLGKNNFSKDLNSLLTYIDNNIDAELKYGFLKEVIKIFNYMVEWNYRLDN